MLDLFGNLEEQQKAMQSKLDGIVIEEKSAEGEVTVRVNGNKRLVDISIDPNLLAEGDVERVEDLILVTFNAAIQSAEAMAEAELKNQINTMLPGGLGGLFGS